MKRFLLTLSITTVLLCAILFFGCFNKVTPCAWVTFESEGYVYYSTSMYGTGRDHIYLYENESDAEKSGTEALSVVFEPRILGPEEVNGKKATLVDISTTYSMRVYINKKRAIYSPDKSIYLNGEKLTPTRVDDGEILLCLKYEGFTLERGNPNGKLNGKINILEYK